MYVVVGDVDYVVIGECCWWKVLIYDYYLVWMVVILSVVCLVWVFVC